MTQEYLSQVLGSHLFEMKSIKNKRAFIFQSLVFLIISCYGGGFSCMPAYLSDIFGTRELSAIHGRILTAWGLAGVVGPTIVSFFWEQTHSYTYTMFFFAAALC